MSDIFNTAGTDNEPQLEVGFNDLVGDDRKYKDPDALAKAYAHLEQHAKTLERENNDVRAERDVLAAKNKGEDRGQEQPKPGDNQPPAPIAPEARPAPSDDNLRDTIRKEFQSFTDEQIAARNMDEAVGKLIAQEGSEAKAIEAIRNKAKELNVSVEWLRDTAARSPTAFYNTMGINSQQKRDFSTPGYDNQMRPNPGSNVKGFEHYEKIRKEDPKLYWSANVQSEMQRAARELGQDFYKN